MIGRADGEKLIAARSINSCLRNGYLRLSRISQRSSEIRASCQLWRQINLKPKSRFAVGIGETVNCRCLDMGKHSRSHLCKTPITQSRKSGSVIVVLRVPLSDFRDERMRKVGRNCNGPVGFAVAINVIDQQQQTVETNARAPACLSLTFQQSL